MMDSVLKSFKSRHIFDRTPYTEEILINTLKSPVEHDNCLPCEYVHDGSCEAFIAWRIYQVTKNMGKLYFVIHTFPYIFFKNKELRNNFWATVKKLCIALMKSLLYVNAHGAGATIFSCHIKRLCGGRMIPAVGL
jgi:hypothetical protein